MNGPAVLALLVMGALLPVTAASTALPDAEAVSPNRPYFLLGSGYAATDQHIKPSDWALLLKSGSQTGGSTPIGIEGGHVTVDGVRHLLTDSAMTSLRDGKYIRMSATAESDDGRKNEITISALGRLVQDTNQGSLYTFTGRITEGQAKYKIIYIGQLANTPVPTSPSTTTQPESTDGEAAEQITVRINKGASNQALADTYVGKTASQRAGYFTIDRLIITPGTKVTFINDDTVPHTLVSGSGLSSTSRVNSGGIIICQSEEAVGSGASYSKNNCDFTLDGRLDSGVIKPGASWTAVFAERGFYRLVDPKYPWVNLVAYNFPQSDSELIRQGSNRLGS